MECTIDGAIPVKAPSHVGGRKIAFVSLESAGEVLPQNNIYLLDYLFWLGDRV
jgi:hypothetical protein